MTDATTTKPKRRRRINPIYRQPGTPAGFSGRLPRRRPRPNSAEPRRLTLVDMLRWAYAMQMVDVITGTEIGRSQAVSLPSSIVDSVLRAERNGLLGTRVDTSLAPQRMDVHPDAETLHTVVLQLNAIDALMIVQYGRKGIVPGDDHLTPKAYPAEPNHTVETGSGPTRMRGDRMASVLFGDERRLARVDILGVVHEETPVYSSVDRRGRRLKEPRVAYTVRTRHEVEFYPLRWVPDLAYCQALMAVRERWDALLTDLRRRLSPIEFRAHVITDLSA